MSFALVLLLGYGSHEQDLMGLMGMLPQEFMPDLIILDYMLPDVNGNVVCQTIRANPAFEHVKIIIVSGVVKPEDIQELMKAGADEFVKKPFNIEKLIERIGELLTV